MCTQGRMRLVHNKFLLFHIIINQAIFAIIRILTQCKSKPFCVTGIKSRLDFKLMFFCSQCAVSQQSMPAWNKPWIVHAIVSLRDGVFDIVFHLQLPSSGHTIEMRPSLFISGLPSYFIGYNGNGSDITFRSLHNRGDSKRLMTSRF